MLFEASNTYASGEPRGYEGHSAYQDMSNLGRWDELQSLQAPNLLIGLVLLGLVVYVLHRRTKRK